MPEESALSTLELNKESFDKPIKLQFFVKDESGARLLLRKLEDSPVISGVTRGNVDIQSTQQARFPFAIDVTLTISKEAAWWKNNLAKSFYQSNRFSYSSSRLYSTDLSP